MQNIVTSLETPSFSMHLQSNMNLLTKNKDTISSSQIEEFSQSSFLNPLSSRDLKIPFLHPRQSINL